MTEPVSKETKVASAASSAGAASSSPAHASSKTSKESRTDATRGSLSRSKSGGKRKEKKREQMPEGFEQWPEEDQQYYQYEVSALLRDAKATRRQCSMKREHPSRWHMFRKKSESHPTYAMEMEPYRRAKETFIPIDKNEQLDLDF